MAGVLLVDHFRWVLMCLFFRVTDRNPGCFKVHLPRHLTWGKHSFPPPPNPTFLFPPLPQEFWSKQVVFTCLLQTLTQLLLLFDAHTACSPLILVTSLYFLHPLHPALLVLPPPYILMHSYRRQMPFLHGSASLPLAFISRNAPEKLKAHWAGSVHQRS